MKTQWYLSDAVIFQNKKWSVETYANKNTGEIGIVIVKDQLLTDFPIFYDNKTIGYDHPEQIPAYIKEIVIWCYNSLKD